MDVPKRRVTRTRTGCLQCRDRRRKCDNTRPTCSACKARGDRCLWGLKVSFHPSRSHRLSEQDTAGLQAVERRRDADRNSSEREIISRSSTVIIDDTPSIVRCYTHEPTASSPNIVSSDGDTPNPIENNQARCHHIRSIPHDKGRKRLRRNQLEVGISQAALHDRHEPPSLRPSSPALFHDVLEDASSSNYAAPFSLGQAISRNAAPSPEPYLDLADARKTTLTLEFIRETGKWCETTDSEMHFTVGSIHQMLKSKAFTSAAMSLASRQLDTIQGRQNPLTLELYQHTIRMLIHYDPAEADAAILATCTLLCVYEMMASEVSEWRRHLGGCASLLRTRNWTGSSKGIVGSCFWAFARIDVWAAFCTDESTLIPTDTWFWGSDMSSTAARNDIDTFSNLTTWTFAKIVNLKAKSRHWQDSIDLEAMVQRLWDELQEWHLLRPLELHPLLTSPACKSNPFPTLVFSQSSSICGNTFYHAGCIILLQTGLVAYERPLDVSNSAVWHARQIGGISVSSESHANWVNDLQPLYIAGRALAGIQSSTELERMANSRSKDSVSSLKESIEVARPYGDFLLSSGDNAAEKLALLKQLARIERETGWKTRDRARDLRVLWGLE